MTKPKGQNKPSQKGGECNHFWFHSGTSISSGTKSFVCLNCGALRQLDEDKLILQDENGDWVKVWPRTKPIPQPAQTAARVSGEPACLVPPWPTRDGISVWSVQNYGFRLLQIPGLRQKTYESYDELAELDDELDELLTPDEETWIKPLPKRYTGYSMPTDWSAIGPTPWDTKTERLSKVF